jgi:hypothetical protein
VSIVPVARKKTRMYVPLRLIRSDQRGPLSAFSIFFPAPERANGPAWLGSPAQIHSSLLMFFLETV